MKKLLFAGLALAMLSLWSCNNEEPADQAGTVSLNFIGHFDQAPLLMYEGAYPYPEGVTTKFQLFQFYLSDVALLPADGGAEVPLFDVELISFKDVQSEEAARQGISITADEIPPGIYDGIRLGIGLTEEFNQTQPGDYTPGHVLTDNYWSWAKGYVFFKIEGIADLQGDGEFAEKVTFHIGLDEHYREKVFSQPLEVRSGQPLNLRFDVDLAKVLAPASGSFVDFRQVTQDHTNDMDLARFLADNLQTAVQLQAN